VARPPPRQTHAEGRSRTATRGPSREGRQPAPTSRGDAARRAARPPNHDVLVPPTLNDPRRPLPRSHSHTDSDWIDLRAGIDASHSPGMQPSGRAPRPSRQRPAHGVRETLGEPVIVFLTVCTKNREPWLSNPEVHELLRRLWNSSDSWRVGRYVLMPDHLHLFCAPAGVGRTLERWVAWWKRAVSVERAGFTGAWQREHWDRRLRRDESYDQKWEYVKSNPVRAGLVERAEDWPFQGVLNELTWW
jgi:putative transposase